MNERDAVVRDWTDEDLIAFVRHTYGSDLDPLSAIVRELARRVETRPATPIKVTVPGLERQMSRAETSFWDLTGSALGDMIEALGEQMAISLWASRLTRELRRRHGLQATQDVLRQMAETMPTVSLYDDDPKASPS
jgi:hypothetical protein